MKNCFFAFLILFCAQSKAQYKKASFLNKKGRTYELGGTAHFISEGHATVPGIVYSFGREHEEKRTFHWFDFEALLPSTFSYTTEDFTTHAPVTVSGKSSMGWVFRYNFAYYLANNSNPDNKLLPFVTAGVGMAFVVPQTRDVIYTPGDSYYDVQKQTISSDFNVGANFGLGLVYNFTPVFGIKLAGGYNFLYNLNLASGDTEGYSDYYFYSSHPSASLGVRLTMPQRD
jgi:hypothetical protein